MLPDVKWLLVGALLLLVPAEALAEYDPPFEMDQAVGEADLIVRGDIDAWDRLAIEESLAGNAGTTTVELGTWSRTFRRLTQREHWWDNPPAWKNAWRWLVGPRHVEVVAFLHARGKGEWTTSGASMDFVPLRGDGVYPFDGGEYEQRKPVYTRRAFFEALREAIRVKAERTRLLALPRSVERSSALVSLALTHEPLAAANDDFISLQQPYHLSCIARGLYKPSAEEEEPVRRALIDEQSAKQKLKALQLAKLIPLSSTAFDTVARYVDRSYPPEIRRAAIMTLPPIDSARATKFLTPLLTRAEPELDTVLSSLWSACSLSIGSPRSVALVDRLLSLVKEFESNVPWVDGVVTDNRISAQLSGLLQMLILYQHPRFIPVLVECSVSRKAFSPAAASAALTQITKYKRREGDGAAWQRWGQSDGSMLELPYDLETAAGRAAWRSTWAVCDAATRRLLVNLWLFEPSLEPAKELFQEAPESDATTAAVTALWEHRYLALEVEKSIVERFVKFVFVEGEPYPRQIPTYRVVFILRRTSFPFPKMTDVQCRSSVVIGGDKEPALAESWPESPRTMSLDVASDSRWGQWGGEYPGAPVARGVLQIRSVETARPENVRWTATFNLDPIQLRDIPK